MTTADRKKVVRILPLPPPKRGSKKRTEPKKKSTRREFSAGFLLFRDTPMGRLWLLLDYGKHWDYPKGHLEKGENAWQAAVRELREETGIKRVDRVGRFKQEMEYGFYSPKKGKIHKTVTYFVGRTTDPEVTVSHEHTGYAWLDYDAAMQKLTYENAKTILRAAHEWLMG